MPLAKRKLLNVFLIITVLLASSSCEQSGNTDSDSADKQAAARQKIRIGWVYAMANAPVLIAKEKGYFAAQGIDVELHTFTSGPRVRKGLLSGKLDLAYIGAPPIYHWYAKGLKSKILAKVNYGQAAVIVNAKAGITSMAGLRGQKIAGVKIGSGMDVLLRGYVIGEFAKMDPLRDLEIRPMKSGSMGAAIESNRVVAAFSWEPFTSQYVLKGNIKVLLDMNKQIPNYPWYVIMAVPKALQEKREAIIKVMKAHRQAVDYLNSSPTSGNEILAKAFNLKAVIDINGVSHSTDEILAMARTRLGWQAELTDEDVNFIQRLMDYSLKLGYMKKKLQASELIDKSFMNEASE